MKLPLVLLTALALGGCLADGAPTAKSGGLDASAPPSRKASKEEDPDKPRQMCESTLEGNDAKTVCY